MQSAADRGPCEVPFVFFDDFELGSPAERNLSAAMVQLWQNFAWTGDPNNATLSPSARAAGGTGAGRRPEGPGQGPAAVWPAFTSGTDEYLVLGDRDQSGVGSGGRATPPQLQGQGQAPLALWANVSVVRGLKHRLCGFWDSYSYARRDV